MRLSTPGRGWFKSRRSNPSGNCVYVNGDGNPILVGDTKTIRTLGHNAPILKLAPADWATIVDAFRQEGAFNAATFTGLSVPLTSSAFQVHRDTSGHYIWTVTGSNTRLSFTDLEMAAFIGVPSEVGGVYGGEFDFTYVLASATA